MGAVRRHRPWQVQEAKAELSALIRAAQESGPQTITRHGAPVAVVVSPGEFERLTRSRTVPGVSLLDFFAIWPALELERDDDYGREVDL